MVSTSGNTRWALWVGILGQPFWLGALAIAFLANVWFGLAVLMGMSLWALSLLATSPPRGGDGTMTCRRSGSFDTARRGLPEAVVPRLRMDRAPRAAPPSRVRLQQYLDTAALFGMAAVYGLVPPLLPLALFWALVSWWVIIRPRRYHALVQRLHKWCLPAMSPALSKTSAAGRIPEARLRAQAARAKARCIRITDLKKRLSRGDSEWETSAKHTAGA
jgi:hypothetical protein